MTYAQALKEGTAFLKGSGILEAETDAWLLLSFVCGIDRTAYYLKMREEMPDSQRLSYEASLKERARRVPLQHITGEQEFMGLRFLVSRDVLIPRQDTEILVEEAIKRIAPGMDVLDLCTGSGCIAISLKKSVPGISIKASDKSGRALRMAQKNAKLNQADVAFVESDLFRAITGTFDMIVSNPPYIPTGEILRLMPEVRDHEPALALDGSEDGLSFYRNMIRDARGYLRKGGFLLLEIGSEQGKDVSALLCGHGYRETAIIKDLAGLDRVAVGRAAAE